MILEQRIDNILGPWPTPDQTREGMLLLAQHLQRHDELVAIQRDIDAYATDRRMPDDALDSFEAQRDALRREIWEATMSDRPGMLFVPKEHLVAAEQYVAEMEARLAERDADAELGRTIREFVPKEGHLYADIVVTRYRPPTTSGYSVGWATPSGWRRPDTTGVHDTIADAITEYNERKD